MYETHTLGEAFESPKEIGTPYRLSDLGIIVSGLCVVDSKPLKHITKFLSC